MSFNNGSATTSPLGERRERYDFPSWLAGLWRAISESKMTGEVVLKCSQGKVYEIKELHVRRTQVKDVPR